MKKIYLIVDVTDNEGPGESTYQGECRGMTEDPSEAKAMFQRAKQSAPGRKIVKKTLRIDEVEMWSSSGDPRDLCILTPSRYPAPEESVTA